MISRTEKERDDLRWKLIEFADQFKVSGYNYSANSVEYIKDISRGSLGQSADEDSESTETEQANDKRNSTTIDTGEIAALLSDAGYYDAVKDRLEEEGISSKHRISVGEEVDVLEPAETLRNLATRIGSFEGQLTDSSSKDVLDSYKYKISETNSAMMQLIGTIIDLSYNEPYYDPDAAQKNNEEEKDSSKYITVTLLVLLVIAVASGVIFWMNS